MTALEARDQLAMMTDAKANPTLCPPELDYCLSVARTCDPHGNVPLDPAWCGGWNFNRAAYEGWLLKAGKCANYHDITIDGRTFAANQVRANCDAMAERFRRRLAGTIQYGADLRDPGFLPLTCICEAK